MATIGVLTYTLPDGLKLNKNFINKTLNQNNSNITITNNNTNNNNNNTNPTEKRNTINYNTLLNNNKPNKIINLTNIESLGMIGTDVIVMRTKQKLTPLKEQQNHNIGNQKQQQQQQSTTDSIKQPPAKKQKLTTATTTAIKNVTVTTMPLSNIINTSNVSTKLPINITTNVTCGASSHLNIINSNSITVPLNAAGSITNNFLKQENNSNQMTPNTSIDKKKTPLDNEKSIPNIKICGTNTKTNQPITTGGRKSTPLPQAVARRNARERNRVKQVNNGFAALRQRIPDEVAEAFEASGGRGSNKKLSKVETLRMAVEYIRSLERILGFEYPPDMIGSSAGSDGMLSPLPSDDDILYNSTSDFATNLSERSPQPPLTPPAQYNQPSQQHQQQMQSNFIKNENSVIKIENPNTPSPMHQSSSDDRLSSSFDDANNSLYEHEDSTIYFTDNLPDITTINGQDYLRIPGTNTYQLITPEMLENEENIHPSESNLFNQKPILNMKTNFVDFNDLINPINVHQTTETQQQLPLPSMPFTSSMLDQQRILQISEYSSSPSDHNLQQRQPQQSQPISPLTVNCISDITPALIPSPDQFSSHSSNMSASSFTTNTTASHNNNNNNFTSVIDQHLAGQQQQQQQQQLQNERNFLAQLQHLHNQGQQRQQIIQQSPQSIKVKIEPSSQQQIINRQLPTNSTQLNAHDFASNHNFSRTTIPTTVTTNGNNSHIYETINNVVNQSRCDENSTNNNNGKNKLKITNVKIERNVLLNASHLSADENMLDAIEWWEANTPKCDEC